MKCNNKFWIESFKDLFCSFNLAPLPELSLEEQMNALTRMVFIIFIILLVLDYRYDLIFLCLSLIFIILLYYIQKKKMKENYVPPNAQVLTDPNANQIAYSLTYTTTPLQSTPGNSMWRNQNVNVSKTFNDPNFKSSNQKLVGQAMPRTLINPIIPPPIFDTEYWRPTDFIVPSGINDQKTRELFQSGYVSLPCPCPSPSQSKGLGRRETHKCRDGRSFVCDGGSKGCFDNSQKYCKFKGNCTESCVNLAPTGATTPISFQCNSEKTGCYKVENGDHDVTSQFCNQKCQIKEGYENEYEENPSYPENIRITETIPRRVPFSNEKKEYKSLPQLPGDMIDSMGYNANQLESHNIPSNLAVGSCQKNNVYDNYNKNLFTSIIQPGVYKKNDIIEPISSNMGISFNQQFEPVTCTLDKGNTLYTSHDPRLESKTPYTQYEFAEEPDASDVYDPRFNGYGTNYRTYIEPMTGQVRFYYDDVDAIRRYNYITRNKLDFTDYGSTSGPMRKKEFMDTKDIRKKAQLTFTDSAINHRTDMQERLMRKINANAWQQKAAPIHKRQMLFTVGNSQSNVARNVGPPPPPP
jgi:hypothetical protein